MRRNALLLVCLLLSSAHADEPPGTPKKEPPEFAALREKKVSIDPLPDRDGLIATFPSDADGRVTALADVAPLLARLGKVVALDFSNTALRDDSFAGLDQVPTVDTLLLHRCTNVNAALESLLANKNVLAITLIASDVNDKGIALIAERCHSVASIHISRTAVSVAGLRSFAGRESLHELTLAHMPHFPRKDLVLLGRTIASIDNLELLDLSFTPTDDTTLAELVPLKTLRRIGLRRTSTGNKGCVELAKIGTLQQVDLRDTHVSGLGLEKLVSLTSLREIRLSPGDMRMVESLGKLQSALPDLDLAQVALLSMPGQLPRITCSSSGSVATIELPPRADFKAFVRVCSWKLLKNVQQLVIESPTFGDDDCSKLTGFEQLHTLQLPNATITEKGVGKLRGLRALSMLVVNPECATDDARAALVGSPIELSVISPTKAAPAITGPFAQ